MDEVERLLRSALESALGFCDKLDQMGVGTKIFLPDSSTRETYELSLQLFCLYLISADGEYNEKELRAFNTILGRNESIEHLKILAEKSGAQKDEFGDQAPLILTCTIAADNKVRDASNMYSDVLVYRIYSMIGVHMVVCDERFTPEEYNRLMRFLNTLYNKITNELNMDLTSVLPPASRFRADLKTYNIPDEQINGIIKEAEGLDGNSSGTGKAKETIKEASEGRSEETSEEPEESLEELLNQLNELVGLHQVKYEVTSLINLCRVKQIRESNGMTFPSLSLHLVFSGNPGTGKTTVARLLAKIYKKIGVLSKGHMVEVDRSGLVGGYVGQTALKVQDVVKNALGGILFIDEAYALTNTSSDNDYGIEAVDTLVKAMEDHRDELIVIVAGYPEPMQRFIQANPGLKSRFNKFIQFADYSPEELVQVFKLFCQQAGYRASLDALAYVQDYFTRLCGQKQDNFANAREVRNIFEQAMMRQANRIIMIAEPNPDVLSLLKKEDVSGESEDIGKSEQLARLAMQSMPMNLRMGMPGELMECPLDELELTARAITILEENHITRLGQMIDYLETGKGLMGLNNMNQQTAESIYDKIRQYGFKG